MGHVPNQSNKMVRTFTMYFFTFGNAFFASLSVYCMTNGVDIFFNLCMLFLCCISQVISIRKWGNEDKETPKDPPEPPTAPV